MMGLVMGFGIFGGIIVTCIFCWCTCGKLCDDEKKRKVIPISELRNAIEKTLEENRRNGKKFNNIESPTDSKKNLPDAENPPDKS